MCLFHFTCSVSRKGDIVVFIKIFAMKGDLIFGKTLLIGHNIMYLTNIYAILIGSVAYMYT